MAVALNEWLQLVDSEYLNDFVVEGGAAVKFIVSDEKVMETLKQQAQRQAEAHGLLFAKIDSAEVKLHLIRIYFSRSHVRRTGRRTRNASSNGCSRAMGTSGLARVSRCLWRTSLMATALMRRS